MLLGAQVIDIVFARLGLQRYLLGNLDSVNLKPTDLLRVVRQDLHLPKAQISTDLRPDPIVATVRIDASAIDSVSSR